MKWKVIYWKPRSLGCMGDRSNVCHLSPSSGRSPHFRLTPESVRTVLGRQVSLPLPGTTRPQHVPTVWIIIHQTYLIYTSLHTIQIILTFDIFIISNILFLFKSEINQKLCFFNTVEWFRHISIIIVYLFSTESPWRWLHVRPKRVGDQKVHQYH